MDEMSVVQGTPRVGNLGIARPSWIYKLTAKPSHL